MKKTLMTLCVVLAAAAVQARDETLINELDSWKLYTRVELNLSSIGDDSASMADLGIGWMLNDRLSFGPALAMSLRDTGGDEKGDIDRFDFWYAGLRGDYTFHSSKLVHASASLLAGGGSARVEDGDTNGFFVLEPALNGAVNIREDVELGLTLGYRFTDSANPGSYDDSDFRSLKLGVFVRVTEF